MRVLDGSWRDWAPSGPPASVTIGVLDGVHRGHQILLARLREDMIRTVLTFDPHPAEVLHPGSHPRLITTVEERIAIFQTLGVEQVGILDLHEIKELSPQEFVTGILIERLGIGHLVVGEDFRFGHRRAGDVALLQELGESLGFEVESIGLVKDDEGKLSSSRIRMLIEEGRIEDAAEAMGRRYRLTGTVIEGDHRGRQLGFPTANLAPPDRKVIPGSGVYAGFVLLGEEVHQAAINVGIRPTFGEGEMIVEAYLLDFDGDLYGEELTVEFVRYLRPELAFDSIDQLVSTMEDDVEETRRILASTRPDMR